MLLAGFAVVPGTTNYTSVGSFTFTVPKAFRSVAATCTPGSAGSPGSPSPPGYVPGNLGSPGSPGNPSTFDGAGTATYMRQTSALKPRQSVSVVVGAGGAGGAGGPGVPGYTPSISGAPGAPGPNGSVSVVVA